MKTPFYTNIAQLQKELDHLKMSRTRTFTKVKVDGAENEDRLAVAITYIEKAIMMLSGLKIK